MILSLSRPDIGIELLGGSSWATVASKRGHTLWRGAARAEDAQGTPDQSHISSSIPKNSGAERVIGKQDPGNATHEVSESFERFQLQGAGFRVQVAGFNVKGSGHTWALPGIKSPSSS